MKRFLKLRYQSKKSSKYLINNASRSVKAMYVMLLSTARGEGIAYNNVVAPNSGEADANMKVLQI
jgi:hypothetical protein